MNWETFYLICFVVGIILSLLSALGGHHLHLPGHLHMHGPMHIHGHVHMHGHDGHAASAVNFSTITAFLAWFGAAGYLVTKYSAIRAVLTLGIAAVFGLAGAAIVFWFLIKVLFKSERALDPADFEMIGVLGRMTSAAGSGMTGEIVFSRNGSRCYLPARPEEGHPIAKGVEVVVTRYESGIAYVRAWDEVAQLK